MYILLVLHRQRGKKNVEILKNFLKKLDITQSRVYTKINKIKKRRYFMKNFFKKPLNIVSVVLAVLGIVGMIVILCVPHGKTYTMKDEVAGKEVTYKYVFKGDEVYMSVKTDGEWESDETPIMTNVEYKGGKAYIANVEAFKINAFRITAEGMDEPMTCAASIAFFIIAGVMTLVGVAGVAYGALSKKKK